MTAAAAVIANPYTQVLSLNGSGLNNGKLYVGVPNQDPTTNPQAVYWDAALTVSASQPLNVMGGYITRSGTPAIAYTAGTYSLKATDKLGVQIFYIAVTGQADVGTIATYAALRASSFVAAVVYVAGGVNAGDGGEGLFFYDPSDTTTADDGGTVLVDALNRRWKRPTWRERLHLRNYLATGDGTTDDTASAQAFVNACATLNTPGEADPGVYRTTAPITVPAGVCIDGVPPFPANFNYDGDDLGTWFYLDHTGKGFDFSRTGPGQKLGQVRLAGIATRRNQPTPGTGWTPTANDFDFYGENSAFIELSDIFTYNATKGIGFYNGSQCNVFRWRGQVFDVGLHIEDAFDICRIDQVHLWPYWDASDDVTGYMVGHLDALNMGRIDGPMISNFFCFAAKNGWHITQTTMGTTNRAVATNLYFDAVACGILMDDTVVGSIVQVCNLVTSAGVDLAGGYGVRMQGQISYLDIVNYDAVSVSNNALLIDSTFTGNLLRVANLHVEAYDQANTGSAAVSATASNTIELLGDPVLRVQSGSTGPNYGSAGGQIKVDQWRDFTPTITTGSGTITTLGTVSGRFKYTGNQVSYQIVVPIATNGTGATDIQSTQPPSGAGAPTKYGIGTGRELSAGKALTCIAAPTDTKLHVVFYDGTYPGFNGCTLIANGQYEVTAP